MKVQRVRAMEILDSRGNPTVQAEVVLAGGVRAVAQVPSGASTGSHEALELRDGDAARYGGKGVLQAVRNVEEQLGPAIIGMSAADQPAIDRVLIGQGSDIGANATLAVSCAVARAAAIASGIPLWRSLAGSRTPVLPTPMVNIISGGLHAGRNIEFQDFLVIPSGYSSLADTLEAVVRVHKTTAKLLAKNGFVLTGAADEGGWGPQLGSNEEAAAILREAIAASGARMDIALDVAASHFGGPSGYRLENRELSSAGMADLLGGWIPKYGIVSIEDPLGEDDWEGWRHITRQLGPRVRLIGDDLFVTNLDRLNRGIREGAANAVLVKMNQIGTVTQTFAVIDRAREAGFGAVISARSGETEDAFLADLAVASGAGQIKIGSITRSERLAKYNRLLEIERWEMPA
ncbi:MAG TPA: phosphopyruvate hydratase [Bryobacteraceae bacterium]|nr:phosphopyruvate hydratase [Bryobacteraceae bacterium]